MTSAIEYSYIDSVFSLKVNSSDMKRAVRVKQTVKDKIMKSFNRNVSNVGSNEVSESVNPKQDSLLDLSEEKLKEINDILNKLKMQEKVSCNMNRAVLFTKALVSKIERVRDKWFMNMPKLEETPLPVETTTVEKPSVDLQPEIEIPAVSAVIPGTWDDEPEMSNNEVQADQTSETKEIEAQSEFEIPTFTPIADGFVPNIEEQVSQSEGEPEVEVPIANAVIPSTLDNELEAPNIEVQADQISETTGIESQSEEQPKFVPEPSEVDIPNTQLVQEPSVLSTNKVEVSQDELVSEPPTVDVEKGDLSKETIEERLSRIIKNAQMKQNSQKTSESSNNEDVEHTVVEKNEESSTIEQTRSKEDNANSSEEVEKEKPELTQAGVLARLQRLNNAMKEKDATIRILTNKYETAKDETTQARAKIGGYEAVVNDLTMKNNELSQENESLYSKLEEVQATSQATITRLEAQVSELTDSKTEEVSKYKKTIAELNEEHAKEIAELKEKHAKELRKANETKDRQIQAIYATISEALGEPIQEEEIGHSLAA